MYAFNFFGYLLMKNLQLQLYRKKYSVLQYSYCINSFFFLVVSLHCICAADIYLSCYDAFNCPIDKLLFDASMQLEKD